MKTPRCLFCALAGFLTPLLAQDPPAFDPAAHPIAATLPAGAAPVLSAEQLDQLLGPIALYPDALIALILPASTSPTDLVLAARYLRENANDLSQVENRAWDDSVKSLTHYPDIVKWMDENLNWTKQLGDAFATQPAEVMKSIQRLRARAQTTGALIDTPQQQVIVEQQAIRIVPAQPDVIYVPTYDPAIVYVDRPVYHSYGRPLLTFGLGWRVGPWLAYDFDWHRCHLWVGDRHRPWHGRHDWRHPIITPTVVTHRTYPNYRHPRQWTPPSRWTRPTYTNTYADRGPDRHYSGNHSNSSGHRSSGTRDGAYQGTRSHDSSSPRVVSPSYQGTRSHDSHRLNTPSTLPVAPPLHVTNASPASAPMGPHPSPSVTTTAPSYRSRGNEGVRSNDLRPRTHQPPAATAPVPAAPPLRVSGPSSHSYATVAPSAPAPARTYTPRASAPVHSAPAPTHTHAPRASAPIAAPPMHVQNASRHSAPMGPVAAPAPAAAAPASRSAPPAQEGGNDGGGRVGRDRRSID